MITREFTIAELEALEVTCRGEAVISDEVIGTRRWYEIREVILRLDGQCWKVEYKSPLTEMQEDIEPFDGDPVTATLVGPYAATVTKYRPVESSDGLYTLRYWQDGFAYEMKSTSIGILRHEAAGMADEGWGYPESIKDSNGRSVDYFGPYGAQGSKPGLRFCT